MLANGGYPERFRKRLFSHLERTGTKIILDDHLDDLQPNEEGIVVTRKGKKLNADLVVCSCSSWKDILC